MTPLGPPTVPAKLQQTHDAGASFNDEDFLAHLRHAIAETLLKDDNVRIDASENTLWIKLLKQLYDAFLATFSFTDDWNAQPEKVKLLEACLEAVGSILAHVDGVLMGSKEVPGSHDLALKLFSALFTVCHTLDLYANTVIVPKAGVSSPNVLRDAAGETAIHALRCIGGGHSPTGEKPMWKVLRNIIEELLSLSDEILHPTVPSTFPFAASPFHAPRLRPINPNAPPSFKDVQLIFSSADEIPAFLSLIVQVTVNALHPSILCDWFLFDLEQRVAENVQQSFQYCLSTHSPSRFKALTKISHVLPYDSFKEKSRSSPLMNIPFLLLRQRLLAGSTSGWDTVDSYFLGVKQHPAPARADLLEILKLAREDRPAEGLQGPKQRQAAIVAYFSACISQMNVAALNSLQSAIAESTLAEEGDRIAEAINARLSNLEITEYERGSSRVAPPWREDFLAVAQKLVHPQDIDWMEDDDDQRYVQRALDDIVALYKSRQLPFTAELQVFVLDSVLRLCDLLGQKRPCKWNTVHFCVVLSKWLLQGTHVPAEVKRKVFIMVCGMLKLHTLDGASSDTLQPIARVIVRSLIDPVASVRLNAGKAWCALIALFGEQKDDVWDHSDPYFAQLYKFMDDEKNTVKETVILIVGGMAKDVSLHTDIVGQAVCFLVAQLGNPNPVLKGSACIQILAAAKCHKKPSVYPLLLPYMERIAPFLVRRMCTHPMILNETCRIMCISTTDFLGTTLAKTLPVLFANREQAVLEAIGKELGHRPTTLLLKNSHEILAHVFRMERGTQEGLDFITKMLTSATSGAQKTNVHVQSVVKSCLIPLLAELVTSLGDRNDAVVRNAITALKKVDLVLNSSADLSQPPIPNLGAFLKDYLLGLLSHINEMLQDVQGKKPVEVKQKILRSLGALVVQIGSAVASVAPQIMATFQTMVGIPELSEDTLYSWHQFITMLSPEEMGPHIGLTSAAFVASWSVFTPTARALAKKTLHHCIVDKGKELQGYIDDLVDISTIPELRDIHRHLPKLRGELTPIRRLSLILERALTNNHAVVVQSLCELKHFMLSDHRDLIQELASGDIFDPIVGQIVTALLTAAGRDVDENDPLRPLAFECLSILGAVDPDRSELGVKESSMIVYHNFTDDEESIAFALHLITDLLVEAFRSTSDMKYQSHLAFTIQELLRFCGFTPALVAPEKKSVPVKARKRWNSLPKHVLETVTPLLEARYTLKHTSSPTIQHPIYPSRSTYREWIQLWTIHLISQVSGETAKKIFGVFPSVTRNKDVAVAHSLLPHLVLNILLSGSEESTSQIRLELLAVLEDQVNPASNSSSDKKMLSAQAVFMLLDHLNRWIRRRRQDIAITREKQYRLNQEYQEQLTRVDSILSNINQDLLAKAALQCKAYALSLMNFESRIVTLRERDPNHPELPTYYEWLHEIYAHLDEPDGMEGISTMILSPSLEHQIRHHESSGQWTSAQSCWEVRLQQSPDNVDFHLGLLRCLRNLGHYDTLRTHVRGVLTRNPDWQPALSGFQIESAWMVGAWDDVQSIVESNDVDTPQMVIARLLLAMRSRESKAITNALSSARLFLGGPIAAAGAKEYRRSYEAMLDLHLTHELEIIYNTVSSVSPQSRNPALTELSGILSARLDTTLPTFRTREPILSMRRTAFALIDLPWSRSLKSEIGRSWLASAKIARKAGQWQTAYSAMLQSRQSKTKYSFIESAKLVKSTGEPLHALQQLENSMRELGLLDDDTAVLDLTLDHDEDMEKMKAKVRLLRARWMNESERFEAGMVLKTFTNVTKLMPKWESGQYYLGQFQDECFKNLPAVESRTRGLRMNLSTVRAYAEAINLGTKYIYQTVPRLLTLWLDLGENEAINKGDHFKLINQAVAHAIKVSPVYKWFTAFPQIVSRIGHTNKDVYAELSKLMGRVIHAYPNQALWLFASVIKTKKRERSQRGLLVLDRLKNNPSLSKTRVPSLIIQSMDMTNELLELCNYETPNIERKRLTMTNHFPKLARLGKSELIVPLQESLVANLPPASSSESAHQPFPADAPTFVGFGEEIEVMHSLAKPRKITIYGSNGQTYMFLGKPKDDLRKDARLMDFNAIINKLLKANSESRRRQLHIRTYGVVTLNEECGFIQWVPHTRPVRSVLLKLYEARQVATWSSEMAVTFSSIKVADSAKAGDLFTKRILSKYPPVFHEWFIETFPEPTAWLASRLTYGRTAAVMSMVGFILGLGDRHGENILLDDNTGDLIHVDFNCLFEKGKQLETPERVPFRLTQNLIDALGVTGVEGVFRTACEVTMQLLRVNKDSLMSVLDAFIHDPLVEWEEEKIKLDRRAHIAEKNFVRPQTDLQALAKNALTRIEKKLRGLYRTTPEKHAFEKEVSTSNLVQLLIQEATDIPNLARMYPGWASWH